MISPRNIKILESFLDGASVSDLVSDYKLSVSRIRQILSNVCYAVTSIVRRHDINLPWCFKESKTPKMIFANKEHWQKVIQSYKQINAQSSSK